MSETIELKATDGFVCPAYVARPVGKPKGAVVVLQEIFGVNAHIRAVADGYCAQGYLAVAPATFHRVKRGVELGYDKPDMEAGIALKAAVEALPVPGAMADIQAAIDYAAQAGKVGLVGYCWGGTLAYLSATRLQGLKCAVGYYVAHIVTHATERARVPVILHFAERDEYIPLVDIARIQQEHPAMPIHSYPGTEHGFNCDEREFFEPKSAALARQRTLSFIAEHLR